MAGGKNTTTNNPPDKIDLLTEQLAKFQAVVTSSMADVSSRVESLERRSPETPSHNSDGHSSPSTTVPPPRLKLDVPRFDGSNPHGWIFKISQFFSYHQTPEEERITVASFYLDGAALAWYQWMYRNGQIVSWMQFLQALELRFAPTAYDDPRGKLFKLQQSSSVASYLSDFESLANRIVGLSPLDLLSCFISGLKPEIRRDLLAQQPSPLSQAAGLARLQEEKLNDILRLARPRHPPWQPPSNSKSDSTSPRPAAPLLPTPPAKPRFRHLSETELAERREKGLCFKCDERFHRNHRCKARFLLLIADGDDDKAIDVDDVVWEESDLLDTTDPTQLAHLGLHAMSGVQTGRTFRVMGRIHQSPVHVLVDGGSSLNFIQTQMAHTLGLAHSASPTLKVLVGNGEELLSTQVCKGVQLEIQGHISTIDLYVINLSGPDVVLGTPWLESLGPIIMDYAALTMQFNVGLDTVVLKGETGPIATSISLLQLKKLTETEPTTQLFSLSIIDTTTLSPPIVPHPNTQIQSLLDRYNSLFSEPTHLPPPRFTDHSIPLIPNSGPVNVRPYRYPHAQKQEIENQISKLLASGWIQPSNSPFSSPVLLLRKKDGSWRMCVDYRALNAITVKDRFPLPTIEELLDELGSARVFTKLDLTSGFHQIRLNASDYAKTAFRTHDGHYEYKVMPFGLCNAPATFQATMNDIFRPLLRKTVIVFFDDILVYSNSEELHLTHLAQVFDILSQHQFFLKLPKCSFGQGEVSYLGHIVSQGSVAPDPAKIQAIVDWPLPKNLKGLRGFLGLSGFYRKFIRLYAAIAQPLTNMLRRDSFKWDHSSLEAFEKLKQAMVSAPVLALPSFSEQFTVQTDASGVAMGAVLLQGGHPIAFFSQAFCPRMSKASAYLRELHAITSAVKRWRQYLLGSYFIIQTDHKSLK